MKTESHINFQLLLILLIPAFVFVNCLTVVSQTPADSGKDQFLPPAKEQFENAADTVAPWRKTGCLHSSSEKDFYGNPCHWVTKDESDNREIATLYNADGSIWFRFNLTFDKPNSLRNKSNKDFVPFAAITKDHPQIIVLRMVGESKNWYEVEVNETTRATKFVLKSDPTWSRASWDFWLTYNITLKVNTNLTPLLDKPDGKIIEESSQISIMKVELLKTEGDWAYVRTDINQKEFDGWIRWRKGRNILVGTVFTNQKIPEIKTDVEDN